MDHSKYLTDIPELVTEYGLCKTLAVRREVIHIKHIFTEVFVRKTIDIDKYLNYLDMSLFRYMEIMTNRIRSVHHFSREYVNDPNVIVKADRDKFFPTMELLSGLKNVIALDFDGVITKRQFSKLYELCVEREHTVVCSANPTITPEYFERRDLSLPTAIYSMKGKRQKINKLIELQSRYDYVFYVDNEPEYLEFAWLFGIQTYHWNGNQIKYFTMKSK